MALIKETKRWYGRWADFYRFQALIQTDMASEDVLEYINHGHGDATPDDQIKQLRQEDTLEWLKTQQK